MYQRLILIFIVIFVFSNCAKKEEVSIKPPNEEEAYKIYEEALNAMNIGEFYFAAEKFAETESSLSREINKSPMNLVNQNKSGFYNTQADFPTNADFQKTPDNATEKKMMMTKV